MAFCLRFIATLMAILFVAGAAFAAPVPAVAFKTIEAAQSGWSDATPPVGDWTPVQLPDDWSKRWQGFDGVVWYRLTFDAPGTNRQAALMVDYWSLAGSVWLNGSLLYRDASLIEPLSRSWNVSRLFYLSPPGLRDGENTLLVRVSGLSAFQPGLGAVTVGDAVAIQAYHSDIEFLRRDVPVFEIAFTLALAIFFLIVWLLRRSEAGYGWYALMSLAWTGYSTNQIATSTWPFNDTNSWSRINMIMFMLCCVAFFMFTMRFCERRFPRLERSVLVGFASATLWMLLSSDIEATRITLSLLSLALYLATCIAFLVLTRKLRRLDVIALNTVNFIVLLGAIHDMLLFTGVLSGTLYSFPITTQLRVVSMAFVLAWHFVASLTRIERFNQELIDKINVAKRELALNLSEQHELALSNTRQAERVSLLHNLHDGLGGTLVNNIALLERRPESFGSDRFLSILKELREELRVVVDTSTGQSSEAQSLAEWLVPLRSRYVLLCENREIACDWQLAGLENCYMPSLHSRELMRMLQECVTNSLKHADPTSIHVALRVAGKLLLIRVEDDGRGFDVTKTGSGTGLEGLRTRTRRLNGTLRIVSQPGSTVISAVIPLPT
jgi:hypothetical protein